MSTMDDGARRFDRRDFFKTAGAGLTAATVMMTPREQALAQSLAHKAGSSASRAARGRFAACSRRGRRRGRGRGGAAGGAGGAPARPVPPQGAAGPRATAETAATPIPAIPANRDQTTSAEMKQRVRRDHDARLPAVDQGHLPGRYADGSRSRACSAMSPTTACSSPRRRAGEAEAASIR